MKRIFISTNHDLHGLFNGRDHSVLKTKLDQSCLSLLTSSNVVYYNGEAKRFDASSINSDIIIIKDSIPSSTTDLLDTIFNSITEADVLLHHSREKFHLDFIKSKFVNKKYGEHTTGEQHTYEPVFKIIFGEEDDKVNKILEVLGFTDEEVNRKNKLGAYIQLYKALKILPLRGNWNDISFQDAKTKLETKIGISLVVNKLSDIIFIQDFDEYYKQLDDIESQIINLSSIR